MKVGKTGIKQLEQPKPIYTIKSSPVGPIITNKNLLPCRPSIETRIELAEDFADFRLLERDIGTMAFCEKGYGLPLTRLFLK